MIRSRLRIPARLALIEFGVSLAAFCGPLQAAGTLVPMGAERVAHKVEPSSSYALPIGPWADGTMLTRHTEGQVTQTAWRWSGTESSTLDLFAPLRDHLAAEGWSVLYECDGVTCGGFDFRYSTRVLPEPEMHVDLADFRYLALRKGRGEAAQTLSLLVSRSEGARAGFAQVIEVSPSPAKPMQAIAAAPADFPGENGRMIFKNLSFASGAAQIASRDEAQMAALAAWLKANPSQTITLTGHTDSTGQANSNQLLSQARASAVREALIRDFGADGNRLIARGAGSNEPIVGNETAAGRATNRRVEATVAQNL